MTTVFIIIGTAYDLVNVLIRFIAGGTYMKCTYMMSSYSEYHMDICDHIHIRKLIYQVCSMRGTDDYIHTGTWNDQD